MKDDRFNEILSELSAMHAKKMEDYGSHNDPYSNVRAGERFGVPAWVGCMIRAQDKLIRIQKAARSGRLANESLEDSMRDLAVYTVIGLCLLEEKNEQGNKNLSTLQ
jgi:hypothetical protein